MKRKHIPWYAYFLFIWGSLFIGHFFYFHPWILIILVLGLGLLAGWVWLDSRNPFVITVDRKRASGGTLPWSERESLMSDEHAIAQGVFDYLRPIVPLTKRGGIMSVLARILTGCAPLYYLVTQHEWREDRLLMFESPKVRRWKLSAASIEALPEDVEIELDQTGMGMYFRHGDARFAIHPDERIVRVEWSAGALYGSGVEFQIEKREDAMMLTNFRRLWIS